MISETSFKTKVLRDLRAIPNSYWVKIQQRALRGVPDILGCANGLFFALELKRHEKAEITALQTKRLSDIANAQGESFVCYPENWEFVLDRIMLLLGVAKPSEPAKSRTSKPSPPNPSEPRPRASRSRSPKAQS